MTRARTHVLGAEQVPSSPNAMEKGNPVFEKLTHRTDPMPLTIAMRQAPRVWKSDWIYGGRQVSEVKSERI